MALVFLYSFYVVVYFFTDACSSIKLTLVILSCPSNYLKVKVITGTSIVTISHSDSQHVTFAVMTCGDANVKSRSFWYLSLI